MKKILFTLAAALTILPASIATQASASPKGNSGNKIVTPSAKVQFQPTKVVQPVKLTPTKLNLNVKFNPNNLTKATKFSQGYMYKGKNHFHWTSQRWDARYGCVCFYDPYILAWFYWCEPDLCYYPVAYCPYQTFCWVVPTPVTTTCLPCQQGLTSVAGVAGVTGTTGVPVEPIDGTLEPPITATDEVPPIPEPATPIRKQ